MTRTHFEDDRNEANLPNAILITYLNAHLSGRIRYRRLLTLALAYVHATSQWQCYSATTRGRGKLMQNV